MYLQCGGHTLAKGVQGLQESSNYRRVLELVKAVLSVLFALICVSVLTSLISLLFESAEFNLKPEKFKFRVTESNFII